MKNYGYIPPVLDFTNDYFSGDLPKIIINSDRDWRPFCTSYEPQFFAGGDTNDCTIFGYENAVTVFLQGAFNVTKNYSERFISNFLNRDNSVGADPQTVIEAMRKVGMLDQDRLPFPTTLAEYQTPRPMPQNLINEAGRWGYDLKHEYVFANNPSKETRLALMREHLQYSTLPCSVSAWEKDANGLYVDNGRPNNHWVVCVHIDDDGCMYMYDSYDLLVNGVNTDLVKKLSPDHHIEVCKRLYIVPKSVQENLTFIQKILRWLGMQIQAVKPPANDYTTPPQAPVAPVQPVVVPPTPKYLWDTPEQARHSVRIICDEEKLTVDQKNLMSQVIHCESGYKTTVTHPNLNKNGKQVSCDYGIAQWNDFYHGSEISPDEAVHNPEKAIRLMCAYVKAGKINQWVCCSSGLFKQYTP